MLTELITEKLIEISLTAGEEIMRIYAGDIEVSQKDDQSPVTEADQAAEDIILKGLSELAPDVPIVAEESVAAGNVPDISGGAFWLVDPLDGTKEFISKNGEFTVNIALIKSGEPIMGAVYAPAIGALYIGNEAGAWKIDVSSGSRESISVRTPPADGLTVVASRSHRSPETDAFIATYEVSKIRSAGSSLKLCLIAEGEADLYPRLGRTMEWDIAAGHAVLRAAGGTVRTLDGDTLTYGKPGFENPHFVARGPTPS